ncbi:MAG: alpha/beta hydrolase [Oscillospiraceae bacterium]|nr:alpha/beta hydrolase [Oscillospiraceae bacterium]
MSIFHTQKGDIHYSFIKGASDNGITLVFLPGLSADHRLFEKQISYFRGKYDILVWDAPGHGLSRPFDAPFDIFDKAHWLHGIMEKENITHPLLIGQSMGGYVSQCFMKEYPGEAAGFISIDSSSLANKYMSAMTKFILRRTEKIFLMYPWQLMKILVSVSVARTLYGQRLMYRTLSDYSKEEYCRLMGNGFYMVAEAIDRDIDAECSCPVLLICGKQDITGLVRRFNRQWSRDTGYDIAWIDDAAHNSNTDRPDAVNRLIEQFAEKL